MKDNLRKLALPGYVVVAFMLLMPVVDVVAISLPLEPGDLQWRFGFLGTMTRFLETPAMGLLLLTVMAAMLEHRALLRAVSVVCILGAVVMLGISAIFALDALQVRNDFVPQVQLPFDRVIAVGMLKILLWTAILAGFGWLSLGLSRPRHVAREGDRTSELVVGR